MKSSGCEVSGLTSTCTSRKRLQPRPPVRELSRWHLALALALAAGAISGVVRSKSGRILVVKGDTYKDKVCKTEFTETTTATSPR